MSNFSQIISSYPRNEDAAIEDGHGDSDFQRYPFADANIEVWRLTRTDITAEEMWDLLREVHGEAAGWGQKNQLGTVHDWAENIIALPKWNMSLFLMASKQSD